MKVTEIHFPDEIVRFYSDDLSTFTFFVPGRITPELAEQAEALVKQANPLPVRVVYVNPTTPRIDRTQT